MLSPGIKTFLVYLYPDDIAESSRIVVQRFTACHGTANNVPEQPLESGVFS